MLLRFSSLVVLFGALLPGASQAFQLAKNTIRLPSLMKLHDAGNSPRHLPDDNAVVEPTSDRRGFFKESGSSLALLLLMGGSTTTLFPSQSFAADKSTVDYKAVAADIRDLVKANPDWGPTFVRLAWHSSGMYH